MQVLSCGPAINQSVLVRVHLNTAAGPKTFERPVLLCLHAALEGAQHIVLEGAKPVPLEAKPDQGVHWYGSGQYLQQWIDYLHEQEASVVAGGSAPSPTAAASVAAAPVNAAAEARQVPTAEV